jgi:DNA repair protein RadC
MAPFKNGAYGSEEEPMEIKIKLKTVTVNETPAIYGGYAVTPRSAATIIRGILSTLDIDTSVEHFGAMACNAKGAPVGFKIISSGGATGTLVDTKLLMRAVLALGGKSFIVWHSLPSGYTEPSAEDRALVERLRGAGRLLDMPLSDSLILDLQSDDYTSMRVADSWR